jgi:cell wall-associated NlpC family hydrolase
VSVQPEAKAPQVGLKMPDSLGIDTSLDDVAVAAPGMDAPDLDNVLPMADYENFRSNMGAGGGSFASMLERMSQAPAAGGGGGGGGSVGASGGRQDVVAYAKKFLGMQYKWGGSNPNSSFDCSGFVQYVLKHFGVSAPRVSYQQAQMGKRVGLSQLQAGDLVAWDNSSRNNGADHIALYIGGGKIMEFYSSGKPSRIRKVGKGEGAWGVKINYGKG